ncbi:hypothetical protein [Sphingomonas bisphenolicum]|uniref:Uncharacterized protein n=1 Tax=Sphingomonas bisphenolicum TaxID=296544 RepID=A0ABM7G637_9SPHN|nr:hypothetical protein [Sphingomonas bisphenolicum]BBF70227.1 hypothetical protein SBA_ch1_24270 [Sphingomonas bisphenolicum]
MSSFVEFLLAAIIDRLPRSSEDWQPGDLAVCLGIEGGMKDAIEPAQGDVLRVSRICMGGLFLHFEGKPDTRHWLAAFFRKVKPDTEPAADEEWVEQLQRFRRKVPA